MSYFRYIILTLNINISLTQYIMYNFVFLNQEKVLLNNLGYGKSQLLKRNMQLMK